MKLYPKLAVLMTFISFSAFAQDYGDLVPVDYFTIGASKTTLKDNADISNYEIKVSPEKEEFDYKVNSVRTPRHRSKKNTNFKLIVERKDGKVSRITSSDFSSSEDATGSQGVQTVSLGTDGKVNSFTNCSQEYGFGWFNRKINKGNFSCATVNEDVCRYMEDQKLEDAFLEQLNTCSEVLGKFSEHQKKLKELSYASIMADSQAVKNSGVAGKDYFKDKKTDEFYEISGKSIKDIAGLANRYEKALKQCKFLKEKNYLREKVDPEPGVAGGEGAVSGQ